MVHNAEIIFKEQFSSCNFKSLIKIINTFIVHFLQLLQFTNKYDSSVVVHKVPDRIEQFLGRRTRPVGYVPSPNYFLIIPGLELNTGRTVIGGQQGKVRPITDPTKSSSADFNLFLFPCSFSGHSKSYLTFRLVSQGYTYFVTCYLVMKFIF